MKARISAMMDGELDERSLSETLQALRREGEASDTWRTYHLISDAMRNGVTLSEGFSARVAERLAAEPTVLAPGRIALESRKWYALSAAASVAAVALVGWLAFGTQQSATEAIPAPQAQVAQPAAGPQAVAVAAPVIVPPPISANDYLLAHQGFSPRVSLQGMAPYVRTVSEPVSRAKK